MCICIFKPREVILTKRVLKTCFKHNPDGAGYAIPSQKGSFVDIKKGYFTFRKFWRDFQVAQATNEPMLIHFRVSTSGKINPDNCHPWRIDKRHALIHNGKLEHKIGLKNDDVSDTGLFVNYILKPIFKKDSGMWQTKAFKWMVEESIGSSNKVVILNNQGEYIIFNEIQGDWHEGCWFSNKTFKEERKKSNVTYVSPITKWTYGKNSQLALPPPSLSNIQNPVIKSEPSELKVDVANYI